MLNYLILVTENVTVTAILLGLLCAVTSAALGRAGKRALAIGAVAGFALAAVVAVLKNATKVIDKLGGQGVWNTRIFALSLLALIVWWICSPRRVREKLGAVPAAAAAGVLAFTLLFYAMPDVLAYPFTFSLNGASVFSTAFFYRLIGWALGVILMIVLFFAVLKAGGRMKSGGAAAVLNAVLAVNAFQQVTKAIQVLYSNRTITGHGFFVLIRYTSNYSDWFIYAAMVLALIIPVVLLVRSFHVNEPYENPAQHRKIQAKWRSIRRWSAAVAVCFALATINLTALAAIDNREVELSPSEECEIRDDGLYIPLTQVEDGHLHRFTYTTPDGIDVRLIVIKKPNSSSYGIGLDACDICGETGYFERNGQIVCKLCDVVMNINTIGFKGGCNPIVIDYSIGNGYITVPFETLIEHEDEFK